MIELKPDQFKSILPYLRAHFPEAIPAYNCILIASELSQLQFSPVERIFVDKLPAPDCFITLTTLVENEYNERTTQIDLISNDPDKAAKCLRDIDCQVGLRSRNFMALLTTDKLRIFERHFLNYGVCSHASQKPLTMLAFPETTSAHLLKQNIPAPVGFHFDILKPEEAEFVDSLWQFRKPGSLESNREKIEHLPSVCLRTGGGYPVSFVMTHQTGVFNHAFTLPEHRGRGLSAVVCKKLTQMHLEIGLQPYAFVQEIYNDEDSSSDKAMPSSSEVFTLRLGWTKRDDCRFFWFRFDPLTTTNGRSPIPPRTMHTDV